MRDTPLALVLFALPASAMASAAGSQVIPPGQEALVTALAHAPLGGCRLEGGAIRETRVELSFACRDRAVRIDLAHPSAAAGALATTRKFALVGSGSVPVPRALVRALAARLGTVEGPWKWVTAKPARSAPDGGRSTPVAPAVAAAPPASGRPPRLEHAYRRGFELYRDRRFEEALSAFLALAREDPGHGVLGMVVAALASTHPPRWRTERWMAEADAQASDVLRQFVAGVAAHYYAHQSGRDAEEKKAFYEAALKYLTRARGAYHFEPRLWIYLAVSNFRLGRQEEAERLIERAVALGGDDPDAYYCRAEIFHRKDPRRSLADIDRYLADMRRNAERGAVVSRSKEERVLRMRATLDRVVRGEASPRDLFDDAREEPPAGRPSFVPIAVAAAGGLVALLAGVLWWRRRRRVRPSPVVPGAVRSEARRAPRSRARRVWRFLGWTFLSITILFGASLVIRVPRPGSGSALGFDAEIGWVPVLSDDLAKRGVRPEDIAGQRLHVIDPGRPHVVVIGDSVMVGHGLPQEDTAPALLARRLPRHQVLNLSVSGYSIDQYYLYLKRMLPRLRPELVVVGIFTGNDYQGTTESHNYGHTKPLYRMRDGRLVLTLHERRELNCVNHFSRTLFFHLVWRWAEARREDGARERVSDFLTAVCGEEKLGPEEGRAVVGALLAAVRDLVREHGAKLLYVLLPRDVDFGQDPRAGEGRFWVAPWPTLRFFQEIAPASGADVLDFFEVLQGSRFCGPAPGRAERCDLAAIFLDGGHLTRAGQELLAEAILDHARRRLGFSP
jgi:tetratricopeptide (TPR) repeat protein/lysophospholipase L1-like esterase